MSNLSELSFSEEFFCDEVREGFFVSETMKRFWAGALSVLSKIDSICTKHNLKWYADWGTLLGTVRHKGFIPWDDDIDISMLRDDYELLLKLARTDLPSEYIVLTPYDSEEYDLPFAKIINGRTITTNKDYLRNNFGCPFVVGIDIFPLDNIFDDSAIENKRTKRLKKIWEFINKIQNNNVSDIEQNELINEIEKENNTTLDKSKLIQSLFLLFDHVSKECQDNSTKEIAIMYKFIDGKTIHKRTCYNTQMYLPFENISMNVPENYHDVLVDLYGDYSIIRKGTSDHNYPAYRCNEQLFKEKAGFYPSRFTFKPDNFNYTEKKETFSSNINATITQLFKLHDLIPNIIQIQDFNSYHNILQTCQSAAITIGNKLENKYGANIDCISTLEEYCELIFQAYNNYSDDCTKTLNNAMTNVVKQINQLIESSRKEILFLICKEEWWDTIKDIYNNCVSNDNNNVSIFSIDYYYKDFTGNIGNANNDLGKFNQIEGLNNNIKKFNDYNLENKHPDIIFTQFPFDNFSGAITIPDLFFSSNLKNFTDTLIYVPCFNPDPPLSNNDTASKAISTLIEQPAVFNSDKILVGSIRLRDFYISHLLEITEKNLLNYWNNKITTVK